MRLWFVKWRAFKQWCQQSEELLRFSLFFFSSSASFPTFHPLRNAYFNLYEARLLSEWKIWPGQSNSWPFLRNCEESTSRWIQYTGWEVVFSNQSKQKGFYLLCAFSVIMTELASESLRGSAGIPNSFFAFISLKDRWIPIL